MAGKEKKSAVVRHLNKENPSETEKSLSPLGTPKRRSGRQGAEVKTKGVPTEKGVSSESPKRPGRPRKKVDPPPTAEDSKPASPQKPGKKNFLEKELEDILENATGRNTPSFGPRDIEDDTSSVRSFTTTFLRTRKQTELEDDLISLRSVKVRKEDDDNMSTRSLPIKKKPGRKPKEVPTVQKQSKKINKDTVSPKVVTSKKAAAAKAKTAKKTVKKPLKAIQNKLAAKKRSTLLIKKKVKNAQKAVKRIYRKRNLADLNASTASLADTNGVVAIQSEKGAASTSPPAKKKRGPKPGAKKQKKAALSAEMPAVGTTTLAEPVQPKKPGRKRKYDTGIVFEAKQSPHDASLMIVHPRLSSKVRKISVESSPANVANGNMQTVTAVTAAPAAVPTVVAAGPVSPAGTSTPYFIQTVPNFTSLKSQTSMQGDWLVTPTGLVLIQAVPPADRSSRVENPETMSTSLTPAVPSPVSGSAPVQSDSMLSEKAKEAEPALAAPLPVIPVAKNISDLLSLKSQMGEAMTGAAPGPSLSGQTLASHSPPDFNNRPVTSERRASHDGSFGSSPPSRLMKRTGSFDRLGARSPRSILELGCEPLFLDEAIKRFETDSSLTLPLPSRLRSGELYQTSRSPERGDDEQSEASEGKESMEERFIGCTASDLDECPLNDSLESTLGETVDATLAKSVEPALTESVESALAESVEPERIESVESTLTVSAEPALNESLESTLTESVEPERIESVESTLTVSVEPALNESIESTVAASEEAMGDASEDSLTESNVRAMYVEKVVEKMELDETPKLKDLQPVQTEQNITLLEPIVELEEPRPVEEPVAERQQSSAEDKFPLVEPTPDVIIQIRTPSPATTTLEVPLALPQPQVLSFDEPIEAMEAGPQVESPAKRCPKDESRQSNRAKKYSRSLDSRQKLLPGLRRRSHPEPRVINIVTCEDGTRRGQALVDELRLSEKFVKVPYPASSSSQSSPPKSLMDSEGDRVSKETILSALGLRTLEEAAELEKKQKKQKLLQQQQILQQQQQQQQLQQQQQQREQLNAVNNNYTGTLKTVIKIQRPEKKGNGRMIYKASSAGTGIEPSSIEEEANTDSGGTKESHESGDDEAKNGGGKAKSLVIPEKASSFSIHPQRLCSDVCTYCFGKFGLLDTPCHIAQLKDGEKRRNILAVETHLTLDSCLCDACFRHVDKKTNCPTYTEKKTTSKRKLLPRKQTTCCVVGCELEGKHNIRRKSLLKLKKSLAKKLILDDVKLEKLMPANLVSLCNRHIYWVDYFMSCGICNKRLSNVHMYRVGPEVLELNPILSADGIPAVLTDKRFLCKVCQCYASIRVKVKDPSEMSPGQRQYYDNCRRRILQGHGIEVPDSEAEGESEEISPKNGKPGRPLKKLKPSATVTNGIPEEPPELQAKVESRPKAGSSNDDLSDLRARFKPVAPATDGGFYKCSSTIQFTKSTKDLFYDLQRPHGNHSSFFRHLVLLEKYFRNGDLVLSRRADPQAVKYINGVNNRLKSYEGTPKTSSRPFTLTPVPSASSTPTPSASALGRAPSPVTSPLSQMQATVQSIGLKPEISITSVPQEPRKLTPKIQENLRALANRVSSGSGSTKQARAVIINRTVGGEKQSLVQVTTGGKTIHLTLAQFRRIQQMQLRKKQYLEQKEKGKGARVNGPGDEPFPNIPKALSVSVTKVPSIDLTKSPPRPD